jgi:hypothetical protein
MLACADRKVLLVDNSKLGRKALHQVCTLSSFDLVVADEPASSASLRELDEAKVDYELARIGPPLRVKGTTSRFEDSDGGKANYARSCQPV